MKPGHVARLKRAVSRVKNAKEDAKGGLDIDGNGIISKKDFVTFLAKSKISDEDAGKIKDIVEKIAKEKLESAKIKAEDIPPDFRARAYDFKGGVYAANGEQF
mmetsp:Transcript_28564/g.69640  ORF Transcript_28564/g.69640 Transcript_28564/m.69640 type:complete len:103 (-) Transcript_28564:39-347(-)